MSKRTVTLKVTSQKDLIKVESSARTFGELKAELPNVKFSGMRTVERGSKNTLQMDDAILPAGDFVLFLVPEKVKSGKQVKKIKDVEKASYNELRSHISFLNKVKGAGLDMDGGAEQLRKRVRNYKNAGKVSTDNSNTDVNPVTAIEEARGKINEAIDTIVANIGSTPASVVKDTIEYLIQVSFDDLEKELSDIKGALKL